MTHRYNKGYIVKLKVQTSDYLRFVQRARRVVYERVQCVSVTDGISSAHAITEAKAAAEADNQFSDDMAM